MKIPLKENYSYKDIAVVHDGVLYIHELKSFHSLMFDVAYSVGEFRCRYCGRKLTRVKATMDHIYPVFLGGPYIPANLAISCSHCNEQKDTMLEEDYYHYLTLSNHAQLKYKAEYRSKLHELLKETPVIPREWFYYEKLDNITIVYNSRAKKKLSKPRMMYKKYNRIGHPLILDRNYLLLDGYYSYLIAKENNVEEVPVIVLENVVLEY